MGVVAEDVHEVHEEETLPLDVLEVLERLVDSPVVSQSYTDAEDVEDVVVEPRYGEGKQIDKRLEDVRVGYDDGVDQVGSAEGGFDDMHQLSEQVLVQFFLFGQRLQLVAKMEHRLHSIVLKEALAPRWRLCGETNSQRNDRLHVWQSVK